MSFLTLATALQGAVPRVARKQAQSAVNQALGKIYDDRSWSFQTGYSGWLAGSVLLNTGTFTVTPYSATVIADLVATQAVNSLTTAQPLLTTLQYRDPQRYFYSIIALGGNGVIAYATTLTAGSSQTTGTYIVPVLDNGGSGTGASVTITVDSTGAVSTAPVVTVGGSGYTSPYIAFGEGGTPATFSFTQFAVLTLDRPWMEPTSGAGQPYMIYQALFATPFQDFRGFTAAWNTTDAWPVNFTDWSQLDLAREDPQRLVFNDPRYIVKYGIDQRAGSATLGWQLYELWPHVLNISPVSFGFERRGALLVNATDTVPYPLTEEMVTWRTREELYDWAEANKGRFKELQLTNWQYLSGKAHAQYEEILEKVTAIDANLRTDLVTRTAESGFTWGAPYSTRTGQLNVGGYE